MKKSVIGIYGGTFDPIHFGHLNLAVELMEKGGLDEVWFCPANLSPYKMEGSQVSAEHRVNMVEFAIGDIPQFKLLDMEVNRKGPSYTIDTIETLLALENQQENPREFRLLLGDDNIAGFFHWHRIEELVRLIPILIGCRHSIRHRLEHQGSTTVYNAVTNGLVETSMMDISSTAIRERVGKNLYCGHLLPAKVLDYIYKNRLYF